MDGYAAMMTSLNFLVLAGLIIIPFWKIFSKAGFSPWLSLLMGLPLINLIVLFYFAFSKWPIHKQSKDEDFV